LQDVFRWAITQGLIEAGRSPVVATKVHKVTVIRERMSLEQFMAIRDHAPVPLRNAMNLALVTGQRREDIASMKFSDWYDERLHVVQGKSRGQTRLALAGTVRLAKLGLSIADVVKLCRDSVASHYLVHHVRQQGRAKPGHKLDGDKIERMFNIAREGAGVKAQEGRTAVTFHEIRSLAERLYREQYGAEFAQMILGHKSAKTTEKYDDLRGEWKLIEAA
jgi:integrase